MPLHTTDALILRTYQLSDADRIVVFLTRDRGKKRGVAKGARRMRSRFRGALEPLTWASVVYFEKESRELVSLNTADTLRSPLAAHHPDALVYVGYLAELIDEWAPEGDPNERLFRLGTSVVDALVGDVPVESLVRYFEVLVAPAPGRVSFCVRRASAARARSARAVGWRRRAADSSVAAAPPGAGAGALSASAVRFLQSAATWRRRPWARSASGPWRRGSWPACTVLSSRGTSRRSSGRRACCGR